uniref:EF-hand domain-containing protein n=1 Tax=Rodentolepis nana TaxID=102285 RepID=A0A0R3T0W7_RODNA
LSKLYPLFFSYEEVKKFLESLDYDKSGKLSTNELLVAFPDDISMKELREFIKRHDKDGDNELDIDELLEFFTQSNKE